MQLVKPEIEYQDFSKIDVRVGTIESVEAVEGSEKLLKLGVDFGELGKRQILTGMAKFYRPEELVGKQTTFVLNLKPRKMMGLVSEGMIFALGLSDEEKPIFLTPLEATYNGNGAR